MQVSRVLIIYLHTVCNVAMEDRDECICCMMHMHASRAHGLVHGVHGWCMAVVFVACCHLEGYTAKGWGCTANMLYSMWAGQASDNVRVLFPTTALALGRVTLAL
jgi:hypothetical protein